MDTQKQYYHHGLGDIYNNALLNDLDDLLQEISSHRMTSERLTELNNKIETLKVSHPMFYLYIHNIICSLHSLYDILESVGDDNEKQCNTYVLYNRSNGLYKIGRSVDIEKRIKSLQTGAGEILELKIVIYKDVENILHSTYCEFRGIGEWFSLGDKELQEIKEKFCDFLPEQTKLITK